MAMRLRPPRWTRCASSLSISCGPSSPALYAGTIPEHLAEIVSQHAHRPALIARAPVAAPRLDASTPTSTQQTRASTRSATTPPNSKNPPAETSLSYADLDALSNKLAWSLAALGVGHATRVAVSLGNTPEYAALSHAIYKLGAILVPLNPAFTPAQVAAALRHVEASVLVLAAVTDLPYKPGRGRCNGDLLRALLDDADLKSLDELKSLDACRVPSLRSVVVVDNALAHPDANFTPRAFPCLTLYHDLVAGGSAAPPRPERRLDARDVVNIQFTSGTTSAPKAAMLSHASMLNNDILISHRMGLAPSDRLVVPPPLFHCFGSVLGFGATVAAGAAILFPSPAFDPRATLDMCVAHAATGLHGVPTMFSAVIDALDAAPPPRHLQKGIISGSAVPETLVASIRAHLGLRDLVIAYGMTETSPVSCMTRPDDPPLRRFSSVGRVQPHTAVKVVDPQDRAVLLPRGQPGELAVAGYLVMQGYFADAAQTAAVRVPEPNHPELSPSFLVESRGPATRRDDPDTVWVYSGDEAVMTPDGFVSITGRIKDLIIRAGENIHPSEIENCLLRHPAVADVAVVGIPDKRLGEAVAVCVVPRAQTAIKDTLCLDEVPSASDSTQLLTPQSIRDWVKSHLSTHLVPKHVFCISDLPKTSNGKIQKFKLRELATAALDPDNTSPQEGTGKAKNDRPPGAAASVESTIK